MVSRNAGTLSATARTPPTTASGRGEPPSRALGPEIDQMRAQAKQLSMPNELTYATVTFRRHIAVRPRILTR
jgi:hypothetical protein